jgi:FkbM family methyltransferase
VAGVVFKDLVRYAVPRSIRNWLRSPSRSIARLADSVRFSLGITRTLQFGPGLSLILHPHAYKVAYRSQILDAQQRAEVMNFISHCDRRMILFDIGANYGVFSLLAAHHGARVIAVEPSAAAVRMIIRQAALNRYTEQIHPVHAAAASSDGTLRMLSSGVFSDDYFKLDEARASRELMEIRAVTIDSLTAEFGPPTHIKIDVEGQEAAVLRGGRKTLMQHSPRLFLELHSHLIAADGGDPTAALVELQNIGYDTFSLDGSPLQQDEIIKQPLTRIVASKACRA